MTSAQASDIVGSTIHADFQTVISRYLQNISTYPFCIAEKCYHAKFKTDPGVFSYQNRRGLNRPILRPLWLMTSAVADVIIVPSVMAVDYTVDPCG